MTPRTSNVEYDGTLCMCSHNMEVQMSVHWYCVRHSILASFEHHKYDFYRWEIWKGDILLFVIDCKRFRCVYAWNESFNRSLIMEHVHCEIPMRMLFALRINMYRIWCRGGFAGMLLCLFYNRFWCHSCMLSRTVLLTISVGGNYFICCPTVDGSLSFDFVLFVSLIFHWFNLNSK